MTPQKNTFNGILNVYKEQGYTSHDVVAKLRGILKQKKIGHTLQFCRLGGHWYLLYRRQKILSWQNLLQCFHSYFPLLHYFHILQAVRLPLRPKEQRSRPFSFSFSSSSLLYDFFICNTSLLSAGSAFQGSEHNTLIEVFLH